MNKQSISIRCVFRLFVMVVCVSMHYLPGFATEASDTLKSSSNSRRIDELFNASLVKLKQNQPADVRDLLIEASKFAPTSAGIHCNLGLAYMQMANLDAAIEEFQISLKYLPTMTEAMVNLAECYRLQEKLDLSIDWYQKYLELRPDDLSALLDGDTEMVKDCSIETCPRLYSG